MQTKLTLRLEDELIKQAKEQVKSLSKIVADYFTIFTKEIKKQKIAPITQSLIGILKDRDLDEGNYKKHLEKMH